MDDPQLQALRDEAHRLVKLLDAPEPGMFTWWGGVHETIVKIRELWERAPK